MFDKHKTAISKKLCRFVVLCKNTKIVIEYAKS